MKVHSYILTFIIILAFHISGMSQNGILRGKAYDAVSNESLPFVTVLISGTTIGTTTNESGDFEFTGLKPGYVQVAASFVGYEKILSVEVMVSNANSAYLELAMQQSNVKLDEVLVTASQFERKVESPVSLRSIGISEIEYNPGANRDISKVIQSFAGVGFTPSFRNDVIIRGGGPSESRFYLDGVEIPNLNHFSTQGASGGAVGIINSDFIRSVNYYSGAFPANRGNALSGVFDFTQINGNKDKLKVRAVLGASEIAATLDGPLGKKSTLVFSARRSYLQFLFSALGLPFLPTFTDYQFKNHIHLNAKNEITFVGIGALDQFTLNKGLKNPDELQRYIISYLPVNEQWNYAIGGVYKHFMKHSFQTIVLSRNMLNNVSYKYLENDESQPKVLDYKSQEIENKFRIENTSNITNYKINVGVNLEYAKYNNKTAQKIFSNGALTDLNYFSDFNMFKWGLFSQFSYTSDDNRLASSLGLRMDGNNYSSSMQNMFNQFSPRISLSYSLTKKLSLNLNTGRYYQLPAYTTLGFKDNSGVLVNKANNLKYIRVDHFIAGLEYKPQTSSQITLEGFYKNYYNYPLSVRDGISIANKGADFGTIGDEAVLSMGYGRAYGVEFMNRHKLMNGLTVNFAYTFVRSEFSDINGNFKPSAWDNRHLITLSASKQFSNNWNVGFKWRFAGGLPYTPYDMNTSSLKQAWDTQSRAIIDYSQLNSKRLGVFHQLDVRVDKKYFFNRWSLMMYLDIQNLYNFQAEQQDVVLREYNADGTPIVTGIGADQRYSLKSLNNPSGTVLPTIGLMIEF